MDSVIEMLFLSENNFHDTFIINESLYDRTPVKKIITDEIKNKLEKILYKNAKNKEKYVKCCIVQDEFKDDDEILQLPCEHCFFYDSIIKWLTEENGACPICKKTLDSTEISYVVPTISFNIESDYIIPYQNINQSTENFFVDFFDNLSFINYTI